MQMKISGASISRHPPRTMIEPQSPRNCNLASFDSFVTSSGMDMRFPVLFSPWSSPYHLHHRPHDHHLDQHDNDQHPERRLQVKWPIARQVNSTFPARILHAQPSPSRLHCHWNCHWQYSSGWLIFLKGYVYQTSGGYAVQGLIVAHNRLLENYILVKFCKAASQGLVALPSG